MTTEHDDGLFCLWVKCDEVDYSVVRAVTKMVVSKAAVSVCVVPQALLGVTSCETNATQP